MSSPQQADQPTPERIAEAVYYLRREKENGHCGEGTFERQQRERHNDHLDVLLSALSRKEAATAPEPVGYRYLYPHYSGETVWRYETGGREINGARPIRSEPVYAASALASPPTADWITLEVERALYLDDGREVVLCDRLPSPVKLLLKLASAPPPPQEWREQAARVLGSFSMHEEDRGPDNEVLVDVLPYTPGEVMSGETVLYRIVDALCARLGPPPQADTAGLVEALTFYAAEWKTKISGPINAGEGIQKTYAPHELLIDKGDRARQALALHRAASQGTET